MHVKWLDHLCDPLTGESLAVEAHVTQSDIISEGLLRAGARTYPIVRGIPRFAGYRDGSSYVKSFSYQWTRWSRVQFESENAGRPMEGHTLKTWERITGIDTPDLQQRVFADFGCGPGRFIEIVRRKHGSVIGLDLSNAVEAARESFRDDPDVLICQADVLAPPLRAGTVDGAFSIGVLHHTPDPGRGIEQMAEVVKPGGWVAAAVYGKGRYYDFPTVQFYRQVFKLLWPVFRHYPALVYSWIAAYGIKPLVRIPVAGLAFRAIFPVVALPDPKWTMLDTFDSVTPSYQSTHESYEVFQWFKRAGLTAIEPSDWGFTSYHAQRPIVGRQVESLRQRASMTSLH